VPTVGRRLYFFRPGPDPYALDLPGPGPRSRLPCWLNPDSIPLPGRDCGYEHHRLLHRPIPGWGKPWPDFFRGVVFSWAGAAGPKTRGIRVIIDPEWSPTPQLAPVFPVRAFPAPRTLRPTGNWYVSLGSEQKPVASEPGPRPRSFPRPSIRRPGPTTSTQGARALGTILHRFLLISQPRDPQHQQPPRSATKRSKDRVVLAARPFGVGPGVPGWDAVAVPIVDQPSDAAMGDKELSGTSPTLHRNLAEIEAHATSQCSAGTRLLARRTFDPEPSSPVYFGAFGGQAAALCVTGSTCCFVPALKTARISWRLPPPPWNP